MIYITGILRESKIPARPKSIGDPTRSIIQQAEWNFCIHGTGVFKLLASGVPGTSHVGAGSPWTVLFERGPTFDAEWRLPATRHPSSLGVLLVESQRDYWGKPPTTPLAQLGTHTTLAVLSLPLSNLSLCYECRLWPP